MSKKKQGELLFSIAVLSAMSSAAIAQENEGKFQFDEVVVTAAKTGTKSLQTLPLAVTVFEGLDIESQGVIDLSNIAPLTPGFTYTSNSV